MATRMQQRRGTAQQWTDADPILAAGEIGYETDTNEFRIGDGVNHWTDLSPFKNLEDLGGSLDDYVLVTSKGVANGVASLNGNGVIPIGQIPAGVTLDAELDGIINDHNADTTNVHGITDTSDLVVSGQLTSAINQALSDAEGTAHTVAVAEATDLVNDHAADTTDVHGIADTALLATKEYAETKAEDAGVAAYNDAMTDSGTATGNAITAHNNDTTDVHGIQDTSLLATTSDVSTAQTNSEGFATSAISTHNADTTDVHGIANTANLATKSYADTAVSDHSADTTSVHGIADTALLATKAYADQAESDAIDAAAVASENYTDAAVAALTKSSVGLGNVENTSDANKPVSTATQTALDLKANLAGPTFTGTTTTAALTVTGNLTVNGTTTTVSSENLAVTDPLIYIGTGNSANSKDLGVVAHFDNGTYQHSGIVRDATDGKWKLFSGVTTEPTDVIDFTTWTKDTLVLGSLEATTVTPSSGVVFSDGTQTKEGVPSRTPIVAKTASYTLSALTERDSLVEISSASAVTLTIPANSAVGYPVGTSIDILQTGAGQITVAGAAGVTVNATPGLKLRTQWSGATLFKRATDTWVVYGDLSA